MTNSFTHYLKKNVCAIVWVQRRLVMKIAGRINEFLIVSSIRCRVGAFGFRYLFPGALRQSIARIMGDFGNLIGDLSRKSVWRTTGSGLNIVFVGSHKSAVDVVSPLIEGQQALEHVGEVWVLKLPWAARQWYRQGADLVIFEHSRIYPFRPRGGLLSFCVPHWVNQTIPYTASMDDLLAGNRYNSLRRNINKSRKAGCEWRFSRSREDFDFFYQRLYVPFTSSRHGDQAHIAPYPLQWDLWIQKAGGGLVLVTQDGQTVAGAVCLVCNDICYNIEVGVRDADESLLQQGINTYLFWAVAEWGKQQGAKFYNMGGSFGWRSNGTFRWKAKWGSCVTRKDNPYRVLSMTADRVAPLLMEKLNAIGYVCETRGSMYGLVFHEVGSQPSESELSEMILRAQKEGLRGLCLLAPGRAPQFYAEESILAQDLSKTAKMRPRCPLKKIPQERGKSADVAAHDNDAPEPSAHPESRYETTT